MIDQLKKIQKKRILGNRSLRGQDLGYLLGPNINNVFDTIHIFKMRWISWKVLCLMMMIAGIVPVLGFAPILSNTTKSRLMMPLRIDHTLNLVKTTDSMDGDVPPRGIVLNTGVGGLTFAGGLLGFVTKGSKASLIAGSTFGGLLLLSAWLVSKQKRSGNMLGAGVAGMLSYVMGKKFLVSKKLMPAGLLTFLGGMAFVYNTIESAVVTKKEPTATQAVETTTEVETEEEEKEEREET